MSFVTHRDPRIDFLRGLALLCVLYNHFFLAIGAAVPTWLRITPRYWGIATAAEAFVFLSGFVYQGTYARFLERNGWRATYLKSLHRAWQLYVATILTVIVCLGIASYWRGRADAVGSSASAWLGVRRLLADGPELFWRIASLQYIPNAVVILGLYIVVLVAAPAYLFLLKRNAGLCIAVALIPYLIAQFYEDLPLHRFGTELWYFNPFAWQFLFVLGMVAAHRPLKASSHRWLVRAAGLVVLAVAVQMWLLKMLVPFLVWMRQADYSVIAEAGRYLYKLSRISYPETNINDLEPVRVLYFLIFAYLVAAVTTTHGHYWTGRLAKPVVLLGQKSLEVFCFGSIYVYVMFVVRPMLPSGWFVSLGLVCLGFLLSVAFAHTVDLKRVFERQFLGAQRTGSTNQTMRPAGPAESAAALAPRLLPVRALELFDPLAERTPSTTPEPRESE